MLLELCVTELEDVATDTERFKGVPQPVTQESPHPYTGNNYTNTRLAKLLSFCFCLKAFGT